MVLAKARLWMRSELENSQLLVNTQIKYEANPAVERDAEEAVLLRAFRLARRPSLLRYAASELPEGA